MAVLTDASQYAEVVAELKASKASAVVMPDSRFKLAVAAFNRISNYDGAISDLPPSICPTACPSRMPHPSASCSPRKAMAVRQAARSALWRNSHQQAALYRDLYPAPGSLVTAVQLQGTELQQHRRCRCGLGVRQVLRGTGLRHRQRQPLWRGRGCASAGGLQQGLPDRPHQRVRRHHRLQPHAGQGRGAARRSSLSRC